MLINLMLLLAVLALGYTIAASLGKAPLWVAVLFLALIQVLSLAPIPW